MTSEHFYSRFFRSTPHFYGACNKLRRFTAGISTLSKSIPPILLEIDPSIENLHQPSSHSRAHGGADQTQPARTLRPFPRGELATRSSA